MQLFTAQKGLNQVQFDLDYYENLRMKNIITFWNFYNGKHWTWVRDNGEPQTTINYAKAMVDIGVDFLMGKSFSISSEDNDVRKDICPILNQVWEDNDRAELGNELARVGGVTGDAWVEVAWDEVEQRVVLTVLDSTNIEVTWNPHRRSQMLQCSIKYIAWDKVDDGSDLYENPLGADRGTGLQMYQFTKVYTNQMVRIYRNNELKETFPNPIGVIPVAHIKNLPTTGFYGESDLQDIISLNREINEKLTETSDIIGYQGAPITLIFGARAERLQKGANRMLSGFPKDARVESLKLEGDLPSYQQFIENVKTAMFDVASVPSHAFGEIQPVSNTSGVALQIMYWPIVRKTEKKRITYGKGLKDVCQIVLKFLAIFAEFRYEGTPTLKIEFRDMLPKDAALSMQLQLEQLNAGLTDRVSVRMEEFQESEEKARERVQMADDDRQAQAEQQMNNQFDMNVQGPQKGQPLNNTETDTGEGTLNKNRREASQGSDGRGRPRRVSND